MPDIAPLLSTTPGPQAPASGVGPLPAAPVAADGSIADFLGQLTASLKSLANTVSPPTTGPGHAQAPALQAAPAGSGPAPAGPAPAVKTSDVHADELPELLATLGFVVVPPVLRPHMCDAPKASSSRLVDTRHVLTGSPLTSSEPVAQPRQTAGQGDTAPTADGPTSPTPNGPTIPAPDGVPTPTPDRPTTPTPDLATKAAQVAPDVSSPPVSPPERVPPADRLDSPRAVAVSSPTVIQPQPRQRLAPQSGDSSDSHEPRSSRTVALNDSTPVDPTAPVSNDQTFNAAMAQASTATGTPIQTTAAHPSEVVSQIVHQAELYRLPSNRGVRIQLHPEDLGGVQVTVRYVASGGLELHINVEHAATGALVQAGWTELRDALATQGISPDRLVMSVTAPDNANQLDFSSSGGGVYRSDSGLAQFGQGGQSDRQRQDGANDARFSSGWHGRLESTPVADDAPRIAASHIDYRV